MLESNKARSAGQAEGAEEIISISVAKREAWMEMGVDLGLHHEAIRGLTE